MFNSTEVVGAVQRALGAAGMTSPLRKDWTQPGSAVQGINFYDLEAPAKILYPVITPLRNRIARVSGRGGIQANWRAITAINISNVRSGTGEGNRSAKINSTVQNYTAAYKTLGLEDSVTFQADLAANGFQDLKALATEGLLRAEMIQEEGVILGGDTSLGLGTTPTPSLVASTTGGTMATQGAASVICVALTHQGWMSSSVAGGVPGQVTKTNADASSDVFGGGSAQQSANATVAVTGATGSIAATVAAVRGAVAYAWYCGTAAAAERLVAITTINSVVLTAYGVSPAQLASAITNPAADNSTNALEFDGLLTQVFNPTYGGYFASQATGTAGTGTPLTSDNAGGITEIDTALKYFWDVLRLSPSDIYMNSQEMNNIGKKILAASSNAAQRFVFNYNDQGAIAGGIMVRSYLNKFAMNGATEIPLHLHPSVPPGTILFYTERPPYPLSNVAQTLRVLTRREYFQIEWPLKSLKYEYGVYVDEVLQNYFPPSFGVIANIANG